METKFKIDGPNAGDDDSAFQAALEQREISGTEIVAKAKAFQQGLMQEMQKVIVGQKETIELVVIALLCRGHVLLEGVPGLGKTLMFRTLSQLMDLNFQHVQFTADMMPSDIVGTEIIQQDEVSQRKLKFVPGPVFCHFLLADEINRTSPKTQSSLLQAMQDKEVSVGRQTYKLEEPFFVLATQNPLDQEGVYPLPEAQLDRFMFNILITYPTYQEEVEIAQRYTQLYQPEIKKIITRADILNLQTLVRGMLISEAIVRYAVDLGVASRPSKQNPLHFINQYVEWGAGPRATLSLILAAKSRALLKGRFCVAAEDVRAVASSVLRHRIKVNFSAEAENVKPADIIDQILKAVPELKKRT